MLVNGRHRKKHIFALDQNEGHIEGDAPLKNFITKYYKELFGPSAESPFELDEPLTHDIPQVCVRKMSF